AEPRGGKGTGTVMAATTRLQQGIGQRIARAVTGLAALCVVLYVAGFFIFAATLDRTPPAEVPAADGIVVLTGGPDRISAAYRLLEQDKGSRLLITGVHRDVTAASLKQIVPGAAPKFDCCIDIGRQAENTIGNAAETAEWVKKRNYRSIIL